MVHLVFGVISVLWCIATRPLAAVAAPRALLIGPTRDAVRKGRSDLGGADAARWGPTGTL